MLSRIQKEFVQAMSNTFYAILLNSGTRPDGSLPYLLRKPCPTCFNTGLSAFEKDLTASANILHDANKANPGRRSQVKGSHRRQVQSCCILQPGCRTPEGHFHCNTFCLEEFIKKEDFCL